MTKWKWILSLLLVFLTVSAIPLIFFTKTKEALSAPIFYVANAGDGTISEINFSEREPVREIQLGHEQISHGIAMSPNKQVVYFGTGFQGKTVHAFDLDTEQSIKELKFDEGVHGIDIHPSGNYVYVALNAGLGEEGGNLAVVDAETFEVLAKIKTEDGPAHVSVTNDGSQIWVANVNSNSVSVIDAYTYQVMSTIPVGQMPNEVAVSPNGDFAFSANVRSNSISVIDMNSFEVLQEVEAGEGVHGVTVSPDGKQVWTANNHSNNVSVIDTETMSLITTIATDSYANHISFSPDGEFVFVTHREANNMVVIDRNDYSIIEKISIGKEPHEMTLKGMEKEESEGENSFDVPSSSVKLKGEAFVDSVELVITQQTPYSTNDVEYIENVTALDPHAYFFFKIDMTTHSGDLSQIAFGESVRLKNSEGLEVRPVEWIAVNNDSHHPQYVAIFEKTLDLSPLLSNESTVLKLIFEPFFNSELIIDLNP
ncbi:YncE family protein [Evansella cellulosilytica]|uniref:40-residue YVTN family beta-propeller repeat protein n=1 Tax=Evansella cellulosilytica (strain ATCC 21833 / DSM 2522 / FERM P-1141 / JCM 9156 / N-4) TaxID=649639 RepID=E6TQU9_EVAC2|nr:YncE family protein [Evansella cellulosilytica]ADU31724.1 40-residue YVTN family beta-propeller repeat protein [Evansella cellulosilytica DSM 2522]